MRFDGLLVSINLTTEFLIISGECWPKRKGMFSAAIELCVAMLVKKKKTETCFRPCEQETRVWNQVFFDDNDFWRGRWTRTCSPVHTSLLKGKFNVGRQQK